MQFIGQSLAGLAIGEDDLELAGIDDSATGKWPLSEIAVVVGQRVTIQSNGVGAGVVKFHPWIMLAKTIGDSADIVRLNFINPKERIRFEDRGAGVWSAGTGQTGAQTKRTKRAQAAGQAVIESSGVGAGQIPEAQRIRVAGNDVRVRDRLRDSRSG